MKKLLTLTACLTLLVPFSASAQVRVSAGGTGWGAVTSGSILFGNSALYLATSSALSFNSAGNRLTVTNASTTALSVSGNAYFPGPGIWNSSGVGIGTVSPTALLDILGDYPAFRVRNYDAAQYSGAGFYLTNTAMTGLQAGYNFYAGINDAADKEGFLTLDQTNNTGSGTGHLLLFTGTSSAEIYSPLLVNGSNAQLTQDDSGYLNYQEVAGGGNGEQSIFQILAPFAKPQEPTISLVRATTTTSTNREFTDFTDENYSADTAALSGGVDHAVSINISKKGTGTFRPFLLRYWNQDLGTVASTSFTALTVIPNTDGSGTLPTSVNVGIGTSTPGSLLSLNALANFTTATSSFYSTGGINLLGGGCFSINGTCITGGGGGSFPFTVTSYGVSTSTTVGFENGILATASSTMATTTFTGAITVASSSAYQVDGVNFMGGSGLSNVGTVFLGYKAASSLLATTSANTQNTAIGYQALKANQAGVHMTALGYNSLRDTNDVSVFGDTALGSATLTHNTTGNHNTAVGDESLSLNTTGNANTALGIYSLYNNLTGGQNTALGDNALQTHISGDYNVAVGSQSLFFDQTGTKNAAIGAYSLDKNIDGDSNVAIGYSALHDIRHSDTSIAIGDNALAHSGTSTDNIAIGFNAGRGSSGAILTDFTGSIYIGRNVANGASSSASHNTFVGYQAGSSLNTGNDNLFLGAYTGQNVTTGMNNILIGWNALAPDKTTSNQLNIGNIIFGSGLTATSASASVIPSPTGNIGIATTSPGSTFAVQGVANFSTATTTFYSSGGINITGGCIAINGGCLNPAGSTPGGSSGQVQFNSSGAFGGASNLFWDDANTRLGVASSSPNSTLVVKGSSGSLLYNANTLSLTGSAASPTSGAVAIQAGNGNAALTLSGWTNASPPVAGFTWSSGGARLFQFANTSTGKSANDFILLGSPVGAVTAATLVGINGTTSPGALLSIAAMATTAGPPLILISTSTAAFATTTVFRLDKDGLLTVKSLANLSCIGTDANGLLGAGTCSGGGAWPFTPSTNFGVAVQSTSTPEWFTTGLQASSTNQFVNTNIWGNLTLTATTSALLATDASGNVIATSSVGANYITGTLGTINTTAPLGGGAALTRGGTLTLTCTTCNIYGWPWTALTTFGTSTVATTTAYTAPAYFASSTLASQFPYASTTQLSATSLCLTGDVCRTTWPSASAGAWPWTIATTFGTSTNASTTGQWFQQGLYASSTSQLLNANIWGNLGIGSSTPWGNLSMQVAPSAIPAIAVATSTVPESFIFGVWATSTALVTNSIQSFGRMTSDSWARVGIGTATSYNSTSTTNLLDQLTVNGRINTEDWMYEQCYGGPAANQTSNATHVCGDWNWNRDSTGGQMLSTSATSLPYISFTNGNAATANDGDALTLGNSGGSFGTLGTTTPVLETNARIAKPAATGTTYYIGFTDQGLAAVHTVPTTGCYFTASTTQANWIAMCVSAGAQTLVDTTFASSTNISTIGSFYRFRIEADAIGATFYMGSRSVALKPVARITTNYPATTAIQALVAMAWTTGAAASTKQLDVQYIKLWGYDPPFL